MHIRVKRYISVTVAVSEWLYSRSRLHNWTNCRRQKIYRRPIPNVTFSPSRLVGAQRQLGQCCELTWMVALATPRGGGWILRSGRGGLDFLWKQIWCKSKWALLWMLGGCTNESSSINLMFWSVLLFEDKLEGKYCSFPISWPSYVHCSPKVQFRASDLHHVCSSALKTPLQFIRNIGFTLGWWSDAGHHRENWFNEQLQQLFLEGRKR